MTRTMAANQALTAARRVRHHVVTTARHRGGLEPISDPAHDGLPVPALCACVLGAGGGDGDGEGSNDAWPPRSVAELIELGAAGVGLAAHDLPTLLGSGLAALDEAAWQLNRQGFAAADRAIQLRAIYHLESGRAGLSRRRAAAFIDAFLALAAEAYLRDATERTAQPAAQSIA